MLFIKRPTATRSLIQSDDRAKLAVSAEKKEDIERLAKLEDFA